MKKPAMRKLEPQPRSPRLEPGVAPIGDRCRLRVSTLAWTLAVMLGMLAVGETARAAVAYGNLAAGGTATADDLSFGNRSRIAQQFTAASSGSITSIKLNLYRDQSWYGPHQYYDVEIWSGSGSLPTASLATLANGDWNTTAIVSGTHGTPGSTVEFTSFTGNTTLAAGTTYWIVVTQAGNGPASKRWIKAGSGNQVASYNANQSSWSNEGTSFNLGVQISVGAVPGAGVAAIGMAGAAAGSRRRRR